MPNSQRTNISWAAHNFHKAMEKQNENFDSHHGVRELPPLAPGDTVWVPDRESEGTTREEVAPHSYEMTTSDGTYHRN